VPTDGVCVKLLGSGIMPKKSPQNHPEGHAFTLETCVTQKRDAHPTHRKWISEWKRIGKSLKGELGQRDGTWYNFS
jgi:hypothetical protein